MAYGRRKFAKKRANKTGRRTYAKGLASLKRRAKASARKLYRKLLRRGSKSRRRRY